MSNEKSLTIEDIAHDLTCQIVNCEFNINQYSEMLKVQPMLRDIPLTDSELESFISTYKRELLILQLAKAGLANSDNKTIGRIIDEFA